MNCLYYVLTSENFLCVNMSKTANGALIHCQPGHCILYEARLYSGLTMRQACAIRGMFINHEFDAHEIIFREGEPSTYLYVLRQGLLKLTSVGVGGREQIIGLATPGRLLGLQTKHGNTYGFTAVTLSPASVCKLRNSDMLQVLEQNPAVSLKLIDMLNQELTEAQALIRVLGQKTAEERVAWFLLTLAHADSRNTADMITIWLSRREMAEMLGLTIETVSRLISSFRREGLIDVSRRSMRILNLPRLQARAKFMSEADNGIQQWVTAG